MAIPSPTILSTKNAQDAISAAVARLQAGECVAIPTETVYGLAGDATNGKAISNIYEMKARPSFNPLICHVDGLDMAARYGELNEVAIKLANAFWPGPLTLIVPVSERCGVHSLVTAGLGTIGLRCPKGISREIISAFGKPLAAPSANRSGRISPTSAPHVAEEFSRSDLLILDEGPCIIGLESTIVKVDGDQLILFRPGAISIQMLEKASSCRVTLANTDADIEAPGMMASHYAPDAVVKLNCTQIEAGAAWLGFGPDIVKENAIASRNLSSSGDLVEAASNLYGYLKEIDTSGAKTICVAPIPESGLGIAINDRLRRAAAPRNDLTES